MKTKDCRLCTFVKGRITMSEIDQCWKSADSILFRCGAFRIFHKLHSILISIIIDLFQFFQNLLAIFACSRICTTKNKIQIKVPDFSNQTTLEIQEETKKTQINHVNNNNNRQKVSKSSLQKINSNKIKFPGKS